MQTVRFGSGSSWVQKVLSGTKACDIATFGSDPAYGLDKVCQVSSVAVASYSAQFSWTIPSIRTNGTALTLSELSGYEIYYTDDSGSVAETVSVSGGSKSAHTLSNIAAGRYHFAISAIDTNGQKSALSSMVDVTFGQ